MTELQTYLNGYFGIPEQHMQQIVDLFKRETMDRDEYFVQEGRECFKLSFIKAGYLRVYKNLEDKEVTQWISGKGYFVTDLSSLVFDTPSRWSIRAMTDSELFTIGKDDYKKIGAVVPEWQQLEKLFLAKCFLTLEDRVFTFLSMTAEERYMHLFESDRELFNQIPLHYLASMLGMTPETLSRIRKKQLLT